LLHARPSSWKTFRLLVHLSVPEELLGCTLRRWNEASIPSEGYPQCRKEYRVHGVQGTVCVNKRRYALRTTYMSLKIWMKNINHPHSRDQNREVFPVPPTLKYSVLGSLCCREISLWKRWLESCFRDKMCKFLPDELILCILVCC